MTNKAPFCVFLWLTITVLSRQIRSLPAYQVSFWSLPTYKVGPRNPRNLCPRYLCSINDLHLYISRDTFTDVMSALQIHLFMQNKAKSRKVKLNVNKVITRNYGQMDTWSIRKNKAKTNPNKAKTNPILANKTPIRTQNEPNSNPISRAKNSCARLWILLQCLSENFDKPGERKAGCSARPKLRTDPMNLLGTMPAKEGKIDLKHSFCGSAFFLAVFLISRKGNENDRD